MTLGYHAFDRGGPRFSPWVIRRTIGDAVALLALGGAAVVLAVAPLKLLIAALASAAAAIGTLSWPALGLTLIALAVPFGPLIPVAAGVNGVDLLVGLVVAAWLARGVAQRKTLIRSQPLFLPLLAFIWCAALSLTQAVSWRDGLSEWLKWAEFAALYLVASQVLERRSALWVLAALCAAGLAEVVHGAYQFFRQVGPEAFILQGRFMRASGMFQQPNPYAGYLGYLFPVAASLAVGGLERWRHRRLPRDLALAVLAGVPAIALTAGIIMSWSRGAWLGLAAGTTVVLALRNRRMALVVGAAVAILLLVGGVTAGGAGWLPASISERIGDLGSYLGGAPDPARTEITDANFSILERIAHWQAGQRMFADHPWLGVGIGNFAAAYPTYAPPHWYEALGHAHNAFINALAETGILGFSAFLAFWIGIALFAWRSARRSHGYTHALAIGLLGTWVYLSVHNQFDNLFVQHLQLQLALLLGVLVAFMRHEAVETTTRSQTNLWPVTP